MDDEFPEETPEEIPEETQEVEGIEPLSPYNGLDDVIDAITDRAVSRIEDCLQERGQATTAGYQIAQANSWLAKRQIARTTYAGNLVHRQTLGGVFGVQGGNLSLRTMARIISLRAAKQAADLVGSEPFMQAMPAKSADTDIQDTTKAVEAKVQEEIAKSNMRMALAESIRVALSEGERAIKITWEKDETRFFDEADVAVDESGPIKTPNGNYIYRNDDLISTVVNESGEFLRKTATNEQGQPIEQLQPGERIEIRLKKEPAYVFTADPVYERVPNLLQSVVHRNGLHVAGLFSEDFIYPINRPSLDDPDCDVMVHRYDADLESVCNQYCNEGYAEGRDQLLESAPQSMAGQANENAGEHKRRTSTKPVIGIYETYFRTWITPEGAPPFQTWLFLVIDWAAKKCIYAQYLGRMKMKKPPFFLLRGLESEPGRAYGVGISEKFADRDLMIDCWFNRAAQKSSMTNSITCAHADGLEEVRDKREIAFGTGKIFRIAAGSEYGANNPPVFRINLNEMSDKEFELFRELVSSGEAEFGVVDPSANNSQNERGQQVATAVRNIERTGNTLNEASTAMQGADIVAGLKIAVDCILENMESEEMIWIPGEEKLATLNRDEIRNLERDVKILSTKAKGSDLIEAAVAAKNTILEYVDLPKFKQKLVRDQYITTLKSLNVADSDEKLKEPTDEEIAAEARAMSQQSTPPSETMNMRLADIGELTPEERAQVLAKFGITASPPEEVMMMRASEKQSELEKSIKVMPEPTAA